MGAGPASCLLLQEHVIFNSDLFGFTVNSLNTGLFLIVAKGYQISRSCSSLFHPLMTEGPEWSQGGRADLQHPQTPGREVGGEWGWCLVKATARSE